MKKLTIILSLILSHLGFSQITDTGNKVGIGIGSPVAKLHVYESTGLGTTYGNFQILSRVSGSGTGNSIMENKWLLRDANGNNWLTTRFHNGLSVDASYLTPGVDTKTWWERDPASGSQFWGNGSDTQMTLIGGNLGIGTTGPTSQLDVRSSSNKSIRLNYNNESAVSFWPNNANSVFHISHGHDNKLYISQGGTVGAGKLMTFVNTGNVGIGTTTPDSKLSVNGNIHTKEVKVDLIGWSDFVFAKDYDLPTLKEVEQHIKEKGYLKDIPSAEDVKENGILLGEMDSKLLQKIEELTLYTIEQQKEIENQKDKIKKLEKENGELQSLSDRLEDIEKLLKNKNN